MDRKRRGQATERGQGEVIDRIDRKEEYGCKGSADGIAVWGLLFTRDIEIYQEAEDI